MTGTGSVFNRELGPVIVQLMVRVAYRPRTTAVGPGPRGQVVAAFRPFDEQDGQSAGEGFPGRIRTDCLAMPLP